MTSKKKKLVDQTDDVDTAFNPNKVAMAIHYYYTCREKVSWEMAQTKFRVCSNTFNRYKPLWSVLRINELPRSAQLKRLRECILEHHIIIRGGNYYLSHAEEQHLLQWIITASERGKPFTGIQIRRMAAAIRTRGRKPMYDSINHPSACVENTSSADTHAISQIGNVPDLAVSTVNPPSPHVLTNNTIPMSHDQPNNYVSQHTTSHDQPNNYVPQHTTSVEQNASVSSTHSTANYCSSTASSASTTSPLSQHDIERIALEQSIGSCDSSDINDLIESIHSIDPDATRRQTPCYSWYKLFLNRYKHLITARRLKSRSAARYCAEDADRITAWFNDVYLPALVKYDIKHADQVLAMDETGVLDNAELHSGVKYVCSNNVTKHHEERGSNNRYSILHICSALGITLPPITIFQGTRMRIGMLAQAPNGTKYQFQESGYFISDFLPDVIRHILKYHRPTTDGSMITTDPRVWIDNQDMEHLELIKTPTCHRILLMDNASVHRNIEAEKLAEENNIHIIYLPPNTTHFMQVSDVAVFASMKKKWYSRLAIDAATAARDDIAASKHQVSIEGLSKQNFWVRFRPAWDFGTMPWRIVQGFQLTGQWPPNKDAPLKALPALKHGEDAKKAAEHANALRSATLEEENRQLKRQLANANHEIRLLKQNAVSQSASLVQSALLSKESLHGAPDTLSQQIDESTSFDRITNLISQFTPPRKIQPKAHSSARNVADEIHPKYISNPRRLHEDDDSKEAHEMQRLARLGQVQEHQTIIKGNASAMGKAEAQYLKELTRAFVDASEKLEAAKSKKNAETLERERAKRAAKKSANGAGKTRKRKRSNDETEQDNQSSSINASSNSSNNSSAASRSKKRKVDVVASLETVANQPVGDDDLLMINDDEYASLCQDLRNSLDYTPMTGAMRLRIKWIRRAQRSIDQYANWTVTSCDEELIKVRRLNDEPRTKRSVRRSLM
jgi:hypothetical protein